jgi:hypothetical protein
VLNKEFKEVNEFIKALTNFEPFKFDIGEATIEQNALNIAVVISYARNFNKNYGFYNTKEINDKIIEDFSVQERELHVDIIKSRNKEFAHSDASSYDVEIYTEESFSYSLNRVRQLLDKDQLEVLSQMVSKIRTQIREQIKYLK